MIRLAAVGDLMLGDSSTVVGFGLRSQYPGERLVQVLAGLAPQLRSADLVIGNLECPLASVGIGGSRWSRDQMRGDIEYARVLRDAGFNAVSLANNHAVQHGDAGFSATVEALRAQRIAVLGLRGSAPWQARPETYRHESGATAALLAYSWRPRQYGSGPPPYAELLPEAVLADVARARDSHDSVIVSLHWGEEFVTQPSSIELEFAHALVEKGADVILGHHPHVVRPVEVWRGSVIAYSLGNAVTDMVWMESLRRGLLVEVELGRAVPPLVLHRIRVEDDYRSRLVRDHDEYTAAELLPHDGQSYETAARMGLLAQRFASYWHTLHNLHRFPPEVLKQLVWTTLENRLRATLKRIQSTTE